MRSAVTNHIMLRVLLLMMALAGVHAIAGRTIPKMRECPTVKEVCEGVSRTACNCTGNCTCNCVCAPYSLPPTPCPPPPPCLAPTSTAASLLTPPPGYAVQPRAIYKFFGCDGARSWVAANKQCTEDGGHLAIPKTMADVFLLVGMVMIHPHPANHSCSVHIGFYDKDGDGKFESVTGEPMKFANDLWGPGQPDGDEDENCVTLDRNGQIADDDCDEPQAFACEIKPL